MDRPAGPWVVDDGRAEDFGSPPRLFCFAHAGGGPSFYRQWGAFLRPENAVRRVLLPGRESRLEEPPFRHIADLVDPLCAALEPQLDRPYALFGHSMGAVIAYEVARRVSGAGTTGPRCLIVSGRKAPGLPANRPPLSTLPDDQFVSATYKPLPGGRLDCPVIAYLGTSDPEVEYTQMLDWQQVTTGEFTMRVFRGGHFYLKGARPDVLHGVREDLSLATLTPMPPRRR